VLIGDMPTAELPIAEQPGFVSDAISSVLSGLTLFRLMRLLRKTFPVSIRDTDCRLLFLFCVQMNHRTAFDLGNLYLPFIQIGVR
jgi:hypothetical protein